MASPKIDRVQIENFFDATFPNVSATEADKAFISLRAFHDGGQNKVFALDSIDLFNGRDAVISAACNLAQRCADAKEPIVFCPPLAVFKKGKRARQEDIAEAPTLSAECDTYPTKARKILEALIGPATFVVASGGIWINPETGETENKLHLHWRLAEPATGKDLFRLQACRDNIARRIGADTSGVPICHPFRWPGSVHRKGKPRITTIICQTENEVDLDTLCELLGVDGPVGVTTPNGKIALKGNGPDRAPERVFKPGEDWWPLMENIRKGENYHTSLASLASKMIVSGMNGGATVNMLRAVMEGAPFKDDRWWARYDDIPRTVSTAEEKFRSSQKPSVEAPLVLKIASGRDLALTPAPPREWEVPDMIPAARVTGVSGDGSAGKSLLLEQLSIAVASRTDWIGKLPRPGKCLFVTCEDDKDEIHRRLRDIIAGRGDISPDDLDNFQVIDMVGEDALLATLDGRSGRLIPTGFHAALVEKIEAFFGTNVESQGRILILDTLAKVYGGDENIRLQVTQFVGFLDKIAIKYHVAIILPMHPSLSGRSTGTGESGSTGWHGSMRARMFMTGVAKEGQDEPDPYLRQLAVKKTNYGLAGEVIALRWSEGRYVLVGGKGSFEKIAEEAAVEEAYLRLLKRAREQGQDVSPSASNTQAAKIFVGMSDNGGFTRNQFKAAQQRLLDKKKIKIEPYGPQSKPAKRLVPTTA